MWWTGSFKPEGKCALIVGASQGVGVEIARQLYEKNCSVILVARTESKLKYHVENIKASTAGTSGATASYVTCDASDYDSCAELWDTVYNQGHDPDFIFCCAGSSIPKLFSDLTPKEIKSGVSTNYDTSVNIVHSGFKKAISCAQFPKLPSTFKNRHLILFSSVVAFYSFIGYAQYGPMKAAISTLSLTLRQELGPYNYRVSCCFPGNFQSEGYEEEQKTKPAITAQIEGALSPISSSELAHVILSKLDQGYDTITTDFIGWLLGSSVLGTLPRTWWIFQLIASFLFLLFSPIASWVVYRDILKFFDERDPLKKVNVNVDDKKIDTQLNVEEVYGASD